MIRLARDIVQRNSSYLDVLTVRNTGRRGSFEGSLTLLSTRGASFGHPMVGKTWPLCWLNNQGVQDIARNQTATVMLADYYTETIQSANWTVGLLGFDVNALVPAHFVNDPTAEFRLRLQIWRRGWLSDILPLTLLDETVTVKGPGVITSHKTILKELKA